MGVLRLREVSDEVLLAVKKQSGVIDNVPLDGYWGSSSTLTVARGLLAFWRLAWHPKFRQVFKPGFYHVHDDLVTLTATEFARKHGFRSVIELFFASEYACGYGSMNDIPALYLVKMMKSVEEIRLRRTIPVGNRFSFLTFSDGFQRLWETVAEYLSDCGVRIRLDQLISRIARTARGHDDTVIEIVTGGHPRFHDFVFISTPPENTLQFLDANDEERLLFGRVSHVNYESVVFRAANLAQREWVALRYNMRSSRLGRMFCYRQAAASSPDLFTGYQFNNTQETTETLDEMLKRDVAELGGRVQSIVKRKQWSYFPHVRIGNLDREYYPRLNALQGQRGTYYLGGLFAFESTEHCSRFADFMVKQFHRRCSAC